jgi:NAD(P)H-flavin reductase
MAYQDRFTNWESTGLKIIPVLSRADDSWKGERGYVQDAFLKAQNIANHFSTGAVLCGQKQMSEACLSSLFFFTFAHSYCYVCYRLQILCLVLLAKELKP